ncbi:MAG: carbon-nitrogen hydrolase family protein [Oleiphilus sp.]
MLEHKSDVLNVALIQMQSGADVKENYIQALHFLEQAKNACRPELVIFPENFLCLGSKHYFDQIPEISEYSKKLIAWAKSHSIALVLGSVPAFSYEPDKCLSRSTLVSNQGECLADYDKVHLFDVSVDDETKVYRESDHFSPGSQFKVMDVSGHKLGLSICYDLRFPELYQAMFKAGAEMFSVPSAFTYKTGEAHWEILLRARAIETQSFVLAANQCGTHQLAHKNETRHTWGHSMIIDPWGEILCELGSQPGVACAKLDFGRLQQVRQSMNLLAHKHF